MNEESPDYSVAPGVEPLALGLTANTETRLHEAWTARVSPFAPTIPLVFVRLWSRQVASLFGLEKVWSLF